MDSENEEEAVISYKAKYRQLKNRLKYLIYEHECFENDIQKAQMKLLQLSRDKSFLLDQLMRYEAVVLSGGEETDYSSGDEITHQAPPLPSSDKEAETGVKSETTEQSNKPPSSVSTSLRGTAEQPVTKPAVSGSGAKNTAGTLLQTSSPAVAATTAPSSAPSPLSSRSGSLGKSGVSRKTTKATGTKVSAMAVAKITKAVARARQNPQQSSPTIIATANNSPLIVSLPIGATTVGGRGKPHPQQATPMKNQPVMSLALGAPVQSTAAILASIPVPPKQPRSKPVTSSQPHPSGKGAPSGQPVGGVKGAGSQQASSTSSSSSSSDSEEDTGSDSSSSGSSREETAMDTRGPVPIVHSVPVPAGGPQLLRPKALASPVKAPPKLIPVSEHPSLAGAPSASSPMTTPTGGGATRFLWSNRVSAPSGSETTPTSGFVSIGPLASPTQLAKPSSGSAFQLVTSPPGASPLSRPPSLQELSGTEPAKPHPQP